MSIGTELSVRLRQRGRLRQAFLAKRPNPPKRGLNIPGSHPSPDRGLAAGVPGVHASVRAQRGGCQHDAGSMQFRPAHLTCVLARSGGNSQTHGIAGTTFPWDSGGPRPGGWRAEWLAGQIIVGAESGWKAVPSRHMRCRTTAIRRPGATIARLLPRRLATRADDVLSHDARPRCSRTVRRHSVVVRTVRTSWPPTAAPCHPGQTSRRQRGHSC
ncbi:hypothetical protein Pden_0097 [Paracoccus denitrificans PD1222]|uniref:Uncharacterized protein n=1 Tax=Paracoccus denitrificans (strain Pd 1222) TaxID=318586 RepID=A1AY70_PARDP|nr:hypothetical protein Pden_0097 [Paracoccus denitrificans PD1222]